MDYSKLITQYFAHKDAGEEVPEELQSQIKGIQTEDGSDPTAQLDKFYAKMEKDPEINRQAKINAVAEGIGTVGNAAVNIGSIIASARQIKQSNKGLAELEKNKPKHPGALKKNEGLQRALNEARFKSVTGLDPRVRANLESNNLQAAMAADSNAKTASTGQASTYGQISQANYLNRLKNNANITGIEQDAMNQNLQREDGLRAQSMQENQIGQQQNLDKYYYSDMPQYQSRMKELADLGAAGRTNMYNGLSNVPGNLSSLAGAYGNMRSFRKKKGVVQEEEEPEYTQINSRPSFLDPKARY